MDRNDADAGKIPVLEVLPYLPFVSENVQRAEAIRSGEESPILFLFNFPDILISDILLRFF